MARRTVSYKMLRASKRNIARAQLSRRGIREPRSIGRVTRSRELYSRPSVASKSATARKARTR